MSVEIRIGDCRELLAAMPSESVHCVVTSPPYWGLRDYGVDGQIGLEPTPDAFVAEVVAVFREVRRVLRDDGTCWLNLGDSYNNRTKVRDTSHQPALNDFEDDNWAERAARGGVRMSNMPGIKEKDLIGIPWRVAFALQADGWYLRQDIIWSKPNPMPESVTDRCTKAHEYLFLLSKSARYFYDAEAIKEPATWTRENNPDWQVQRAETNAKKGAGNRNAADGGFTGWSAEDGRNRRSVWTVATQPFSEAHFATFPPDLIEPCIKAGCPKQCCGKCGAPWVAVTERVDTGRKQKMADGWDTGAGGHGTIHREGRQKGEAGVPVMATRVIGAKPSCACNADTVSGVCLDPFGGAGTTGLVADRLGRNAILLELNPTYAEMARRRIANDAGMFAEVAAQ